MPSIFGWAWLALFMAITVVRKLHERRAGRRSTLSGNAPLESVLMVAWGMAAGIVPLVFLFTDWLAFADITLPALSGVVGVVLFVVAIWLLDRSHRDLGAGWAPQVEPGTGGTLVTDGVFGYVRHPMYSAHVVWGIAQALLLPNLLAGPLALVLMIPLLALRIPREERALTDEFGDVYRSYMEGTPRLAPRFGALRPTLPPAERR